MPHSQQRHFPGLRSSFTVLLKHIKTYKKCWSGVDIAKVFLRNILFFFWFVIIKSQSRNISTISNQFQNFEFWLIPPKHPLSELFQEMILRNPQALYILRILEKFENSQKIHFFIQEMGANFNKFQRNSTSAQKLLLTWYYSCI